MPLSYVQTYGDGKTQEFAVPFPYIARAHVSASVDGEPVLFTWLSPSLVKLNEAPAEGTVVEVRRSTPKETVLVDFVDGSTLTEGDLDTANCQAVFLSQEAHDLSGGTLGINNDGTYSALNRRISSIGDPQNGGDAVNKQTLDSAVASVVAQTASDRGQTGQDRAVVAADKAAVLALKVEVKADTALAKRWANEPYNVEVVPGQYSARHWAEKAKSIVNVTAATVSFEKTEAVDAENVQAAIEKVSDAVSKAVDAESVQAAIEKVSDTVSKAVEDVGIVRGEIAGVKTSLATKQNKNEPVNFTQWYIRDLNNGNLDIVHTSDNVTRAFICHDGNIHTKMFGYLADYVVRDVRLTGGSSVDGYARAALVGGSGEVITKVSIEFSDNTLLCSLQSRYIQVCRLNTWYTVGTW